MDFPNRLFKRLYETISDKGIDSILQPWNVRRHMPPEGVLKQLDALSLSWKEISVAPTVSLSLSSASPLDGVNVRENGNATLPVSGFQKNIIDSITSDIRNNLLLQQVNVSNALIFAEMELSEDRQEPPEDLVDHDWLMRWRQRAGTISSNDLNYLWGRILAGEVTQPGSFGLRTLEFLSNISREEATEIALVATIVFGSVIIQSDSLFKPERFSLRMFLALQELGLISGVGANFTTNIASQSNDEFYFLWKLQENAKHLSISHDEPGKILKLPAFPVSRLGKEVFNVVNATLSEDHILSTILLIESKDFCVKVDNF